MTVYSNPNDLRKNSDPSSTYSFYHSLNNSSTSNNFFPQSFKNELTSDDINNSSLILNRNSAPPKFEKKFRRSRQRSSSKHNQFFNQRQLSRCLSVPTNNTLAPNFNRSNRIKHLLKESPTIKLIFKNVQRKKFSNGRSKNRSSYSLSSLLLNKNLTHSNQSFNKSNRKSSSKNRMYLDEKNGLLKKNYDAFNNFSMLAFKRSFSFTNIMFEQTYIKKSASFEKFLQNVVLGMYVFK